MKYLIYNDFSYIIHHKKRVILLILLVPIISILLNINNNMSMFEIMMLSMGTNLSSTFYSILGMIMYLFNVFWFLYFIVQIYIKDLENGLENIFLRIKPQRYIIRKNICFIIITIMIKVLQYIAIILLFLIFKHQIPNNQVFQLLISDIGYILFVQYLFLFLYLIYILLSKNILFLSITVIILLLTIPKNIWNFSNYLYLIVLGIIFVNFVIYWLFSKYSKNLIENI